MGYYTYFSLEIVIDERKIKTKDQIILDKLQACTTDEERLRILRESDNIKAYTRESIIDDFRKTKEDAKDALDKSGESAQQIKWYDWKEDIGSFSLQYPDVLFILQGAGEESGDLWKAYIKNGKIQCCKAQIVYDNYDPNKLVDYKRLSS